MSTARAPWILVLAAVLAIGGAGAASAQAASASLAPPTPELAHIAFGLPQAHSVSPESFSVAQTAIDRPLIGGLTASAGFMCGLHPGADNNGAATTTGYDPAGRFVGARLSLAFK